MNPPLTEREFQLEPAVFLGERGQAQLASCLGDYRASDVRPLEDGMTGSDDYEMLAFHVPGRATRRRSANFYRLRFCFERGGKQKAKNRLARREPAAGIALRPQDYRENGGCIRNDDYSQRNQNPVENLAYRCH